MTQKEDEVIRRREYDLFFWGSLTIMGGLLVSILIVGYIVVGINMADINDIESALGMEECPTASTETTKHDYHKRLIPDTIRNNTDNHESHDPLIPDTNGNKDNPKTEITILDDWVEECINETTTQHEEIREYYFRVYQADTNETLNDFWVTHMDGVNEPIDGMIISLRDKGMGHAVESQRYYSQFTDNVQIEYNPSEIRYWNETVCTKMMLVKQV